MNITHPFAELQRDGTNVRVDPLTERPREVFGRRYAKFIGAVKDAPGELADNHDRDLDGRAWRAPRKRAFIQLVFAPKSSSFGFLVVP